jgi:hypothetical protein
MTLTTEINRIERINQSLRISCAGLDGSALAQFNQLHTRGADGRFGSKSTGLSPLVSIAGIRLAGRLIEDGRKPELAEVEAAYRKLGKDLVGQIEQAKNIFKPEQYAKVGQTWDEYLKDFKIASKKGDIAAVQKRVEKFSKDMPPLLKSVIGSITAPAQALLTTFAMAAFLPLAAGHLIVGRKIEERVLEVAKDFVSTIKQVADLTNKTIKDRYESNSKLFDRLLAGQEAADPDYSKATKAVKLKAFNTAVDQYKIACKNDTIFAPLVRVAASKLLISRLTKLGDRKAAQAQANRVKISGDKKEGVKIKETMTDVFQLLGQPLGIKYVHRDKGIGGAVPRSYAHPASGLLSMAHGQEEFRATLFHEMSHFTDGKDPETDLKAQQFVFRRTGGKGFTAGLRSMNDADPRNMAQTGNLDVKIGAEIVRLLKLKLYGPDELYAPDKFIYEYVGKVNAKDRSPNKFHEVMSNGMQHFSSPEALAKLMEKDPEHVDLCLDYIRKQYEEKQTKAAKEVQDLEEARMKLWEAESKKNRSVEAYLRENAGKFDELQSVVKLAVPGKIAEKDIPAKITAQFPAYMEYQNTQVINTIAPAIFKHD